VVSQKRTRPEVSGEPAAETEAVRVTRAPDGTVAMVLPAEATASVVTVVLAANRELGSAKRRSARRDLWPLRWVVLRLRQIVQRQRRRTSKRCIDSPTGSEPLAG
jgi:hypothetical protein